MRTGSSSQRASRTAARRLAIAVLAGVVSGCGSIQGGGALPSFSCGADGGPCSPPAGASAPALRSAANATAPRAAGPAGATSASPAIAGAPGTLPAVVAAALDHSAKVRRAAANVNLAEVEIDIARAGYQPTLEASAGLSHDGGDDARLTLRQPIYDWGKTGAAVEEARSGHRAVTLELTAEREKTALEAALAFIALERHEGLVAAAQENAAAHARITGLARELAEGGVGDNTDVELALVHQGEAEAALDEARSRLRDARSLFRSRTGLEPEGLAAIPELPLPLEAIADVRTAVSRSPAVAALQAREEAAGHAAEAERASLFPTISVEASVRSEDRFRDNRATAGLRVTSPTLRGMSNLRRVEAAQHQASTARWEAEAAVRDGVQQVHEYQNMAPTLRSRQENLKRQRDSALELRALYEEKFSLGQLSLNDLVTVQQTIYRVERSRVDARYDLLDLQYTAADALGMLQQLLADMPQGT